MPGAVNQDWIRGGPECLHIQTFRNADAISSLAHEYLSTHIMLIGHSGGATIAADIMARHPEVANAAVLVSCPCDVRAFRAHMSALRHRAGRSESAPLSPDGPPFAPGDEP